ncbi:TSUP family transporter [Streptomyces sp. S399]|nr:TSUP family transporter [Streptomyces sp. S399]WPR52193.1 TSUP family transporter [Streptomyces sp. S399]
MTLWEALAVLVAGFAGGALNTAVGSGTLVTFPVLLATGLPPVTATVSNALGLIPGSVSGAFAYRRELTGQRPCSSRSASAPPSADSAGRPADGAAARGLRHRGTRPGGTRPAADRGAAAADPCPARPPRPPRRRPPRSAPASRWPASTGLLLRRAGHPLRRPVRRPARRVAPARQRAQNVLVAQVNAVAAAFFLVTADIDWRAALLIAAGATAAPLGARAAQRLRPVALRVLILTVGTAGLLHMTLG